ncbi:MAG: hypothetical protein K0R61_131 [Microvirga sp.]|jgi:hypothetical protein|nr:hypothetical protein [Microvirga sp.]
MATVDVVRQIGAKLQAARERMPKIKRSIQADQAAAKVAEGRRALSRLDKDLEEGGKLVTALVEDLEPPAPPPPAPPPPPPIGPPPDVLPPPPDWANVIRDKVYSGGTGGNGNPFLSLKRTKNILIRNTKFTEAHRSVIKGPQGDGAIFYDCEVSKLKSSGVHGGMAFYPGDNWDTSADDYGLMFVGVNFRDNELDDTFEMKSSNVAVIGCTGKFSVRIRHGVGTMVYNCPECWRVSARCGPHLISDCPDCHVIVYSGNLYGKKGQWEPNSDGHDGTKYDLNSGHNMQCGYMVNVARVQSATVGFYYNEKQKRFAPVNCVVDPGVKDVKVIQADNLLREPVPRPNLSAIRMQVAARAHIARLGAKTENAWAAATVEERGREQEVGRWFQECAEAAYKAGGVL